MPLLPPPPSYPPAYGNDQYNNGKRVADLSAILTRWKTDAAKARAALSMRAALVYGGEECETLDLFEPKGMPGPRPVLVFIHGGYWRSLSKNEFSWIAAPYVARGIKVAIVDYGLSPRYPLEDIVRQNLAAVAWLWSHAERLGIARERIVVSGHSAGGHLAALMMAAHWSVYRPNLPAKLVHGGVAISGLFDMEPLRHTPYLNADLHLTLDRVAPLSPLYMKPRRSSPRSAATSPRNSSATRARSASRGRASSARTCRCPARTTSAHANDSRSRASDCSRRRWSCARGDSARPLT